MPRSQAAPGETAVGEHYRSLLAPIYLWMMGGMDAALVQGAAEVGALVAPNTSAGVAVDLGAGFGMHAIPLARAGWRVTAIDSSPHLVSILRREAGALPISVVEGDLLAFRRHAPATAELILCMGDTLTHLADVASVRQLLADVAAALGPGGRFVSTFRDYSLPPRGAARFIPVRSDADRIQTCFLEEAGERMMVHDLVHERAGDAWQLRVSRYPKLRLAPETVCAELARLGLSPALDEGPRGMVRVIAMKAA